MDMDRNFLMGIYRVYNKEEKVVKMRYFTFFHNNSFYVLT